MFISNKNFIIKLTNYFKINYIKNYSKRNMHDLLLQLNIIIYKFKIPLKFKCIILIFLMIKINLKILKIILTLHIINL